MTRIIPRLLKGAILGALCAPTTLFALGLGEIHPNSALSQPFDAEIELVNPTADELGTLKVGVAGSDIYSRFGLDRPSLLSSFNFKVVPIGDGRAVIRVSSTRAITEPVITLLVEASWAGGRTVHEYTVFLDPPVFMPVQPSPSTSVAREEPRQATPPAESPRDAGVIQRTPEPTVPPPTAETPPPATTAPVTPPPTAQAEPTPSEPAVTTTPAEPAEPSPARPIEAPPPAPALAGENYEVQRRDSLWRIASRIRPGTPQMINQTMVALYRANPAAFVGNNINRLRSGSVLKIPSDDELLSVDVREANAEVTRQFNEWRAQAPQAPAPAEPSDAGRLRLVTPTEPVAPPANDTGATKQAQEAAAKAQAEQARADAEAKAKAEAEAKAQADAEAKRLLELKNEELARMQREREQQAAAEAAARKAAEEKAAQAQAQPQPAETPPAETPPVAETKPQPKPETKAAPPPPAEQEPSFMDQLSELPWMWILIAIGALVVGAGLIVFSRRRSAQSLHLPMPDGSSVPTMTPADFEAAMERGSSSNDSDTSAFDDPRTMQVQALADEEEQEAPAPVREKTVEMARRPIDETMSGEAPANVDHQDAMAEADFHMAYGLYDQAADLVKIAIQREPKRRDLKFKLLEIFFVWGNKDSFLEAARELYETRDTAPAGEWDRILVMGKQIAPENAMFKGGAKSLDDMIDVNLEGGENRVDIDLFAAPESSGEPTGNLDYEIGSSGSRAKPSKLDFLLDETANRKPPGELDETREMVDSNARTQETPTIESPMLDTREQPALRGGARSGEQTSRERTIGLNFDADANLLPTSDQTAELSIDDLGLDVGEITGSLDQTSALRDADQIGDDELTRIAQVPPPPKARPSSQEPTMEVPAVNMDTASKRGNGGDQDAHGDEEDLSISTIYLEQMEGAEEGKSGDSTHMLGPDEFNLDLAKVGQGDDAEEDTIRRNARLRVDEPTAEMPAHRPVDLAATVEQPRPKIERAEFVATTQLQDMEPVTMSEVGTKLDLARAYMDMGDPDGARSILEEVLGEGNQGQRAEAQRLLDSIR